MLATQFLAALAATLATSRAHMFILSPQPIEQTDSKSPLDPSGSQFPCQGAVLPASGGQKMEAGSTQKLAFNLGGGANTAVHGGGSCQLSITYETDPAKQKHPANWHVIYSIEGGCPTDAPGNLANAVECTEGSTDTACVNEFPFTVPKGVKDGHAIMAWTWFNNVGNREMYMNCANVEFTGGDGSEVESFPQLFVANQAGVGECPTTENVNVKFPNPGKYVTTKTEGGTYPLAVPTGPGCAAGGSGSSQASPSPFVAPVPVPSPQPPAPQPSASSTQAPPPATPAPAVPAPTVSSGKCLEGEVQCSTPGAMVCVDAEHFGICDIEGCAIPQAVAPGTHCVNGQIMRRKAKRGQHGKGHKRHIGQMRMD
ncbi:hypothetical protein CKM354_001085400 [Cercospora kikuchii]|uniref:Lytic polysaccharide monooxygenase n=1 Tax=Cercospora kikuchii TaxID=84275 RepID=A0A9P3CS33_9PEZI|nr:uncharacterized protein CKM354_001085400 [Cercospora kikuchii]GIZ47771.1 hypothetical protein CKM354_001085400 [Cercospora kikuchii]